MAKYELKDSRFIIHDYDCEAPFSSFLPGLAGVKGIPMWSFYTNRGQALCSFGIHHKGNAMMEFNSANTGYENTQIRGFRTFLRINGRFCEPFFRVEDGVTRRMEIERNVLTITEDRQGLSVSVRYFILPNESIGALVRMVKITNRSSEPVELELLDGMPQIIPYGIQNGQYKEMSNLFKSWADIINIESNAPIYKMRASGDDSAEVTEIRGGYYYIAVSGGELLPVIYDKVPVFDFEQSMIEPLRFKVGGLDSVLRTEQCFYNKVPCAFVPIKRTLAAGDCIELTAYAGYTPSESVINQKASAFLADGYAEKKLSEARAEADRLTADVRSSTAQKRFDQYLEQCYMDNFLRGGYPFVFGSGEEKKVVHLFSRKHGDPERDYNFFSIAGEYYSQGNGNYRDVCQNRRVDCFLHPEIEDYNVLNFFSLIQMDGYNPLEIRPSTFRVPPEHTERAAALIRKYIPDGFECIEKALHEPFTPGQLTNLIAARRLLVIGEEEELISELLKLAGQQFEAGFGEGYWSDHWTYNLDLVEDYLSVYPDKKRELLFGKRAYRYYDSLAVVRPRSETYCMSNGKVRQYGAIRHSEKKALLPGFDPAGTNWLKNSRGEVVLTTLFEKMLTLAVNKFAMLDSECLGIEMEGGKPGWNDAMNGLPGLLGSSMPETIELRRLIRFLTDEALLHPDDEEIPLFSEFSCFMRDIVRNAKKEQDTFTMWDNAASLRERFRNQTEGGIDGGAETVSFAEIKCALQVMHQKLASAVSRALDIGNGIMPTFFTYEAADFEVLDTQTPYGLPAVRVRRLVRKDLPLFLEGPARYLASCEAGDTDIVGRMSEKLKNTDVYDSKLHMYKTSESLEKESMEIGRVRAFTPGWLERESIFLHMEYKYFLGLLNAGLYDEFFNAIDAALIPNLDAKTYGRSVLENSSFLASSANPDPSVHGRGFVGRLSGSTVELLSMWKRMFIGGGGFTLCDGELVFRFAPILSGAFFDDNGEASFTLCNSCIVCYHNALRKNTYGDDGVKAQEITVSDESGEHCIQGDQIGAPFAAKIREHRIRKIDVYLS